MMVRKKNSMENSKSMIDIEQAECYSMVYNKIQR